MDKVSAIPRNMTHARISTRLVRPVFVAICLAIVASAASVKANVSGSDDFNDNLKDASKWGPIDFGDGAGTLLETNSRLQFTSTDLLRAISAREWVTNFATYSENFAVQIDTGILQNVSGSTASVAFALEIGIGVDKSSYRWVDIEHAAYGGGRGFRMFQGIGNGNSLHEQSLATASTAAAIRLAFNAATKIFTGSYDENGATGGYVWTTFGSFGISSAGGGTLGNENWNMGANDAFYITPYGYSFGVQAQAGQVYGDNFVAAPEPGSTVLLLTGLTCLCGYRRRRQNV